MANRRYKQFAGYLETGIVELFGSITIGASGAITASSLKGFSVVKTAAKTGRYTITLEDVYSSLKMCNVSQVGAADAARTSTSGIVVSLRNDAVSTAKTFDVQFSSNTNLADADVTSGVVVRFQIVLKNSSQNF